MGIMLKLLILENKKYNEAKLILDNVIKHIRVAKAHELNKESYLGFSGDYFFDIYISSFGLLIGDKVVKFNVEKSLLTDITIGDGYFRFKYLEGENLKAVEVMTGEINEREIENLIEKFRYETGVIPQRDHFVIKSP
jgi:hypothetical protein